MEAEDVSRLIQTLNILSAHGNFIAKHMLVALEGKSTPAEVSPILAEYYAQIGNAYQGIRTGLEHVDGPLMVGQMLGKLPRPTVRKAGHS